MSRLAPIVLSIAIVGCSNNEVSLVPLNPAEVETAETVEDQGSWLSLDRTPEGTRLTITFYDRTNGGIMFGIGTPDGGSVSWFYEHVAGYASSDNPLDPGDWGQYTSHMVAPNGEVFAAFRAAPGGLKVARRIGGLDKGWEIEDVDGGAGAKPDAGQWNSLAIAANGQPVVAHYDSGSKALRVSERSEDGTWSTEEAFRGEDFTGTGAEGQEFTRERTAGEYASLVIDGDTRYIAFYDRAQQTLNLLEGTTGSYTHTVVDSSAHVGQWPSVHVAEGAIHVAYHDITNQDLKMATRSGDNWALETLDDGEYVGADTVLVDKDGSLNVLYFDGQNNDLLRAAKTGASWAKNTLQNTDAVGYHNDAVQLIDGTWYYASYNYTGRSLIVAELTD